jgi:hypothetical protein
MKMNKIWAVLLTATLFASCKKGGDDEANGGNAVSVSNDGRLLLGSDAAGAFYAIKSRVYDTHNGTSFDDLEYAYAWFGSYTNNLDAGTVTANGEELDYFSNLAWHNYVGFGTTAFNQGNKVTWGIQGKAASGVAGFTHIDNTPFAAGPAYTLPISININNSFTIVHTAPSNATGVVYSVLGNKGEFSKYVEGNSGSVTFTSTELKQAALPADQIGFSVMPVVISSQTYNGKNYYFVKQQQYLRETSTQ